jgi:RNA polymerase sigma-70 factor (ECF subfamily)
MKTKECALKKAGTSEALPLNAPDMAALLQLFGTYAPRLMAMIQWRMNPAFAARFDAQDVLNEALIMAQDRWHTPRRVRMTPYSWIYRIALDSLIEQTRRHSRALRDCRSELAWPDRSSVHLALSIAGSGTSPSEALARKELQQRMQRALEKLRADAREVLCMHVIDQLSHGEMAEVLEVSEQAARQRYCRARGQLREEWIALYGSEELDHE